MERESLNHLKEKLSSSFGDVLSSDISNSCEKSDDLSKLIEKMKLCNERGKVTTVNLGC